MLLKAPIIAICCGLSVAAVAQTPPLAYVQLLAPTALRTVQERLHQLGVYGGAVDGAWGQDSQTALQQFQQAHGLQASGQINPATAQALGLDPVRLLELSPVDQPPPPMRLGAEAIRNIQGRLQQMGYYHGPLDGQWGPGTETAITALQQSRGIQPNGQLNPPTVSAMGLDPRNPALPAR